MIQSSVAVTLAAAASGAALAQADKSAVHQHHGGGMYAALAGAAGDCTRVGQVCITHCLMLLGQGDKSLAACASSVSQLLATCDALMKLAASNSKYVLKMAALALTVCEDCEKECRKHETKHKECKDCGDACASCAKECKKAAA
jgi:Cys-rich four helix bundle protein (predicted Tat secretion target)